ncbi:3-oxoacyl-[acyl-carrier-protein] reductase FabG-like [Pieris napi]|uniref:3-oxoacyl-[acyl-carrier-protein] reductase FabG-like n=1 Tax=Pieris napi TaxID=78633 RepID=UPI001FBA6073|nr:3-oxoacyl-[acyl-carrier-protein] reductase FabG-like [Pieris napi]
MIKSKKHYTRNITTYSHFILYITSNIRNLNTFHEENFNRKHVYNFYFNKMDFTDKVVLITGACSGIGAATALYLAKLSAKLALAGQNEKNLLETVAMCEKEKGFKPLAIVADITKEADVERIIKETLEHFKQLDVLVNNCGISKSGGIKTTTLAAYDIVMNTNVRGTFYLTSLAVPHLIKTKGNIVTVSSVSSSKSVPNITVYTMSKAALDQFTRNLAVELGPDGVRANCVNPGLVATNLLTRMGFNDDQYNAYFEQMVKDTPLGRLTEPKDVAALISFLASDLAKSITGATHSIDAGRYL